MTPRQSTAATSIRAALASQFPVRIAFLPWGDVIEDFLSGIGISIDDFVNKMSGGWLFAYIEALRLRGIQSTIFCFSESVNETVYRTHKATGARIVLLPPSSTYRKIRRKIKNPYGLTTAEMFGATARFAHNVWRVMRHVTPYLATPVMTLADEIRKGGCSAIICQEYESPRFDAAVAIGKLLRIPVFATYQGGNWQQRSRLERVIRPLTIRCCNGLIIGSSAEAVRVKKHYKIPSPKILKIFNPLDCSEWRVGSREDARRYLGISDTTRVTVWHGRIDIHTKGLDVLLEAWKIVCSSRPEQDLLLLLAGSGSDANNLEEMIRRMGVPHVRWHQEYILDRTEMRQFLTAADVYVFPSRREGFPVAPLEAMACGLPVVASSAPGIIDIFEEGEKSGGIIVPVGDALALAKNLARLLDDDCFARELGVQARRRVERAFSLKGVGIQLQELFLEKSVIRT
jgi:glycosyltransferase involved in cell wall biosynthesis